MKKDNAAWPTILWVLAMDDTGIKHATLIRGNEALLSTMRRDWTNLEEYTGGYAIYGEIAEMDPGNEEIESLFKLWDMLDVLGDLMQENVPGSLLDLAFDIGVKAGFDIGADQCTIMQRRMRWTYENDNTNTSNGRKKRLEALEPVFKHMIASADELQMLQAEFPDREFNGHHVKCPTCWRAYTRLKRKYEVG